MVVRAHEGWARRRRESRRLCCCGSRGRPQKGDSTARNGRTDRHVSELRSALTPGVAPEMPASLLGGYGQSPNWRIREAAATIRPRLLVA